MLLSVVSQSRTHDSVAEAEGAKRDLLAPKRFPDEGETDLTKRKITSSLTFLC